MKLFIALVIIRRLYGMGANLVKFIKFVLYNVNIRSRHHILIRLRISVQSIYTLRSPKIEILMTRTQIRRSTPGFPVFWLSETTFPVHMPKCQHIYTTFKQEKN